MNEGKSIILSKNYRCEMSYKVNINDSVIASN